MSAESFAADVPGPRVRGKHQRAAILKRAADLASLDGLEQVTIGRLASAMQMSKSGLYAYFTSKEDLQLATIHNAWGVFDAHVLEGAETVEEMLRRWIAYYAHEVFPGGCPLATAAMEFANRDGPVHDALAGAVQRQHAAIHDAVLRASAERLRTDVDADQVAFEIHAVLLAGNQRFRMSRDPAAFAHTQTAITRLLEPPRGGDS
ncbi:MAG: TetR/AcrR family transcriptional regulator [Solirubrobacterales bacterium]|nr:TetR/AcrR family transcriptional regulator [Solirubrobacterales bacterium]